MALKDVSDATFEQDVLQSEKPVLVDFWAEWCGPCKQIAPALDEIGSEMDGRIEVAKVDIDKSPETQTPAKYGVRGIPTLMIFKGGELVASKSGALPKGKIEEWIKENS